MLSELGTANLEWFRLRFSETNRARNGRTFTFCSATPRPSGSASLHKGSSPLNSDAGGDNSKLQASIQ